MRFLKVVINMTATSKQTDTSRPVSHILLFFPRVHVEGGRASQRRKQDAASGKAKKPRSRSPPLANGYRAMAGAAASARLAGGRSESPSNPWLSTKGPRVAAVCTAGAEAAGSDSYTGGSSGAQKTRRDANDRCWRARRTPPSTRPRHRSLKTRHWRARHAAATPASCQGQPPPSNFDARGPWCCGPRLPLRTIPRR